MDALTFSQILFNTLASLAMLLLMVVLCLFMYFLFKLVAWTHRVEERINYSSEKIKKFFDAGYQAFLLPIIGRLFPSEKKRKKG